MQYRFLNPYYRRFKIYNNPAKRVFKSSDLNVFSYLIKEMWEGQKQLKKCKDPFNQKIIEFNLGIIYNEIKRLTT